jgi:hypothetical protein
MPERPEAHLGGRAKRRHCGMVQFIQMIQHASPRSGRSPKPRYRSPILPRALHVAAQHLM